MGNVIIDIEPARTIQAFADLAGVSVEYVQQKIRDTNLFYLHESGQIDEHELRAIFKRELNGDWSDSQLDTCWNSLLFPLPIERLHLLDNLRTQYRIYLLSNTNAIHLREIERQAKAHLGKPYALLFDELFMSYQMGKMKPDPAIYQEMLDRAGIQACESLFIDDVHANIKAANKLGIQTIHHNPQTNTILDYFTGNQLLAK